MCFALLQVRGRALVTTVQAGSEVLFARPATLHTSHGAWSIPTRGKLSFEVCGHAATPCLLSPCVSSPPARSIDRRLSTFVSRSSRGSNCTQRQQNSSRRYCKMMMQGTTQPSSCSLCVTTSPSPASRLWTC